MNFDYMAIWDNRDILLNGVWTTLLVSAVAIPVGLGLGIIICFMRISSNVVFKWTAISYIEIIRNVPLLILIFMVFYALPFYGIRLGGLTTGIICLSIYGGAYFAEIFRGGIQSVPKGQFEACEALGLQYGFYMRRVILPQLFQYIIPPGTNISLTMIKESSLLSMITVAELTYAAHDINGRTFTPVETFTTIAMVYWLISTLFLRLAEHLNVKTGGSNIAGALSVR